MGVTAGKEDGMNYDQWDKKISPYLYDIRYYAEWISYSARNLQYAAQHLPARPAWDTLAREELSKAIVEMNTVVHSLESALKRYDDLPVIIEAAE